MSVQCRGMELHNRVACLAEVGDAQHVAAGLTA